MRPREEWDGLLAERRRLCSLFMYEYGQYAGIRVAAAERFRANPGLYEGRAQPTLKGLHPDVLKP